MSYSFGGTTWAALLTENGATPERLALIQAAATREDWVMPDQQPIDWHALLLLPPPSMPRLFWSLPYTFSSYTMAAALERLFRGLLTGHNPVVSIVPFLPREYGMHVLHLAEADATLTLVTAEHVRWLVEEQFRLDEAITLYHRFADSPPADQLVSPDDPAYSRWDAALGNSTDRDLWYIGALHQIAVDAAASGFPGAIHL